jgi:hypothetical protein
MQNFYYGKKLEAYNGKPFVNDQERHAYFRAYLFNLGIADTRCGDLAKAISQLHSAVSKCGLESQDKIAKEFEGLISACRKYGELEDMQTDFTDENGRDYK